MPRDYAAGTSIVVLTFNRWDCTREFLESLLHSHGVDAAQLVWLDNASTDGTVEGMTRFLAQHGHRFDCITSVKNANNVGFLGGINQAVSLCQKAHVCLVNNDTILPSDWLIKLQHRLDSNADVAAVGPVSSGMPYDQNIAAAGRGVFEARVVYGFCMLTRRSLFDEVGLLDERYGRGVVEVEDWCHRCAKQGYRFLVNGDVVVRHDEPHASYTKRVNAMLTIRNRDLFREKWARGPYHWDDAYVRADDVHMFARSRIIAAPEVQVNDIQRMMATMADDEELVVVQAHSSHQAHLDAALLSRKDRRLVAVCLPSWPPNRSELLSICDANRRSIGPMEIDEPTPPTTQLPRAAPTACLPDLQTNRTENTI